MTLRTTVLSIAVLLATSTAQAAVIASYDFTTGSTASSFADQEGAANVTAGDFEVFVNGALSANTSGAISQSNYAFINRTVTGTTIDPLPDDFLTFTVTPDDGFNIDLDNITFTFETDFGSSQSHTYHLRWSVDSFASDLSAATIGGPAIANVDTPLSGFAAIDSATEFRIYFSDTSDVTARLQIDDVVLNGTIGTIGTIASSSAPEPASFMLAAFGIAGLGICRRRRQRSQALRKATEPSA